MSVTNILLKTLFPIEQIKYFFSEHTQGNWDNYVAMQELSLRSMRKNLRGEWKEISITAPSKPTLQNAFRDTATLTRDLYLEHAPCRILYTDPDTMCVRPLDIFGRFKEFRLFDQMDQRIQPIEARWDGYWNCSVRYFPENLPNEFWERMAVLMSHWDYERYDYEQEMYRQLMWSQSIDTEAWQSDVQFNWRSIDKGYNMPVSMEDFPMHSIIHFGASGDVVTVRSIMERAWQVQSFI